MLLAIDIGNTTSIFGLCEGKKIKRTWFRRTQDLGKLPENDKVIIASVVPVVDKILKKRYPRAVFVSSKNIKGISIKVKNKREVGADRLVNALAAYKIYGGPAVVVDFGTATTFDIISKKGEYLGGAISAGIGLTRDVLHERTAKLPKIVIAPPKDIIGRSTKEALRSGILLGYASLTEGMLKRYKRRLGKKTRVIATGGYARMLKKYVGSIDEVDRDLTLKGLLLAWREING